MTSGAGSMLLCLSMAWMMFSPSISEGAGNGGLAAAGCGQDREGPLRVEGRLLLGHAGSGSSWTGGGRQIVRRPAWMRQPIRGSGRPRSLWLSVSDVAEVGVDLAGDVPFEAAHDLFLGQAFGGAPFDVGAGRRVGAHPGDDDAPQGVVGLPVAGGVEAAPDGLSGGGGDRGGGAQVRPGGLGAQPLGVVPGGNQQQRAVSEPTPCSAITPRAWPGTRGTISASAPRSW